MNKVRYSVHALFFFSISFNVDVVWMLFTDLKYRIMTKEQALDAVEKAIDKAFERGKELSIHSVIDCFSFARYLNENFHYFDNTDVGDIYKDNNGQGLYSEKDIYDEWLNNR